MSEGCWAGGRDGGGGIPNENEIFGWGWRGDENAMILQSDNGWTILWMYF